VYALAYPTGASADDFGPNRDAARKATHALAGMTVAGAPVHVTGFDALAEGTGGDPAPACSPRRCSAARALVVLLFVFASVLAVVRW
jgi:hypothetical protein